MTDKTATQTGEPPIQHAVVHAEGLSLATATAKADAAIQRGKESWAYLYTLLGFALTIETGVVALITPVRWPWNVVTLLLVAALTSYLILENGWAQNKLIGFKVRHEKKLR